MKYLLYICFFLLVVLFFAYINSKSKESFTPKIRAFYRPIIRRTRLAAEGFYTKTTNQVNNFLVGLGLN